MTEHLPECFETWQIVRKCNICDALRACEERVIGAAVQRVERYLQHDVADNWMPLSKADGIIVALKGDKP